MRGPFSIEWLAQSSLTPQPGPAGPARPAGPAGPAASHPEALPAFPCKRTPEAAPPLPERLEPPLPERFVPPLPERLEPPLPERFVPPLPERFVPPLPERLEPPSRTESRVYDVSSSSGVDSDYDSEGRRSLSPSRGPAPPSRGPAPPPPQSPPCGRRSRTAFTAEQIGCLEKSFKRSAYLGTQDKAELCRKLGLSDKQVRNWFQNRRMKMKRSMQEVLAQACQASASQLLLYPDSLQAYGAAALPPYPAAAPVVVAVAPDGPPAAPAAAAPYRPPAALQYGALPLDSFCQYGGIPALVMPAAPHYRTPYQNLPQYY